MQAALALLLSFLTAKSSGLQNITHQRLAWMENLTPLSCMSQRRRRTDAALVFSWIFVWIFVPAVFGRAIPQSLVPISVEVGQLGRLPPCETLDQSLEIVSVTWGKGSNPTDDTMIDERYPNGVDTNKRVSVGKEYDLVIENTTWNDTGTYWCQVTPKKATGYNCSKILQVKPETSTPVTRKPVTRKPVTSQPVYREVTPRDPLKSKSSAEQIFIQFEVLRNLCLLSGVLTILLTNVGGVG